MLAKQKALSKNTKNAYVGKNLNKLNANLLGLTEDKGNVAFIL